MRLPSEHQPIVGPTEYAGRTLDAAPSRDDRSLNFPIRTLLSTAVTPRRKVWRRGPVLDQGPDGACVGHGWAAECSGDPVRVNWSAVTYPQPEDSPDDPHHAAWWIYYGARKVDEWAGEDYSGTSVLAGAKVVQGLGLMDGYRWAFDKMDMRDTLISHGPVVIATPWLSGMFDTDGGELVIDGDEVGWHCVLVNGYDPKMSLNGGAREMVRVQNSWGSGWGSYGSAWVDFAGLWALIDGAAGDVCVPVGRRTP